MWHVLLALTRLSGIQPNEPTASITLFDLAANKSASTLGTGERLPIRHWQSSDRTKPLDWVITLIRICFQSSDRTGTTDICEHLEQSLTVKKYERVSDFECSKWPNPVYNALRVIGVILLAFVFLMILVIINIRKTKESQTSILLRIFTNYLQLIAVALSFNLRYPQGILDAFSPFNSVSSSETFLSFDWFIEDYEIRGFAPNNSIFKIFLAALLPLMIIFVFCIIFVALYYVWNSRFADIKRNIGVSAIWIVFLLHPTLTRVSFNIFQCIKVDTNDFRMRNNLGKILV